MPPTPEPSPSTPSADTAPGAQAGAPKDTADRWAHRRGEPRLLTLCWSIYLLIAAIITVFSVQFIGLNQPNMFQNSTRALMVMTAAGLTILWPMVRLSQAPALRPVRGAFSDFFALMLPAQAIVWPTMLLTSWSWEVTGGVSLLLFSWAALLGAMIAIGAARQPSWRRSIWMAMCLVVVGGVAVSQLIGAILKITPTPTVWLASPFTAIYALTDAPSGLAPTMTGQEWLASIAPLALATPLWALAAIFAPRRLPANE